VVSQDALYMSQISLYRNTLAFGGLRNPTDIWATMKYNHPQAMMLYRELEEKDEDVANALHSLRLSVLERDRSVKPADDSQQALEIAEFVQAQIDGLPDFHGTLDCILDAPGYGFSVQEMIFDTSMGQASLTGIKRLPAGAVSLWRSLQASDRAAAVSHSAVGIERLAAGRREVHRLQLSQPRAQPHGRAAVERRFLAELAQAQHAAPLGAVRREGSGHRGSALQRR